MTQRAEKRVLPKGLTAAVVKAANLARVGITHGEEQDRARKLEQSKTRFRSLLDLAPEGVAILVAERIEYGNPALLRMLGHTELDQVTRAPLADHLHPDALEPVMASVHELMRTGRSFGPLELRARRHDGSYVSVEIVAIHAEWEGRPAVLAIARDSSRRRQLKSQLMQADRLLALGTLAAGVAHEINNPLAYVLLNLQYLLREVPKFSGDPSRLAAFLDRLTEARHGTERVGTIVRDLRAFARTDQETTNALDLRRVLGTAIRIAGAQIEHTARVVERYEAVPQVLGNAARLEQVFLNLLINAAQAFTHKDPARNHIHVSLESDGPNVVAEVRDNGPGIEPALLGRVFDPFFTTKPGVGTGLGLPICHNIVKRLGGQISVLSTPGEGTAFRVSFPARPSSGTLLSEIKVTPVPGPLAAKRARVLVVDDELPLASMLSRVLGDEHDVAIATSGREALRLLDSEPPFDVVLCDLLMPAMSGMDLYRELAETRPGLEARMVFMTGGAFTARAAEFLADISNQWLEKPFDLNQLRRLVRKLTRNTTHGGRRI